MRLRALMFVAVLLAFVAASPAAAQQKPPELLTCPSVEAYEVSLPEQVLFLNGFTNAWEVRCLYTSLATDSTGRQTTSNLEIHAQFAGNPEFSEGLVVTQDLISITYCSDGESFRDGLGVLAAEGNAIRVVYRFSSPHLPHDLAIGEQAAKQVRALLDPYVRTCDGVPISPRSAYYTPLPGYLEEALAADVTDPFPEIREAPADAATQPIPTSPSPTASPPGTAASGPGIFGYLVIGVSGALLIWSLILVRRERRVRPLFDLARAILIALSAVVSLSVIGGAPGWAIATAVAVGGILGWTEGRQVVLRRAGFRVFERRNGLAIAAFTLGLLLSSLARLLDRSGVVQVGVGITCLSAATAVGLVVGRSRALGNGRGVGATGILILGLGLSLGVGVGARAQEVPTQEDRRDSVIGMLTQAIPWDTVGLTGGIFLFEGKPPAALVVIPGLTEVPEPLTRTAEWSVQVAPENVTTYTVEESYRFSLNAAGTCCTIHYEGAGVATDASQFSLTRSASGVLGDLVLLGSDPSRPELPFGNATVINRSLGNDGECRRPISQRAPGASGEWDTYEFNGAQGDNPSELQATLYITCEIPGFDVETATSLLPPVPAATAPERAISPAAPGCPVYQEAFRAVYDPSMGPVPTPHLARLFLEPNSNACSAEIFIGDELPGGVRSEVSYHLATPDPTMEAARRLAAADAQLAAFPLNEIPPEEQCGLGPEGIPLAPVEEGVSCRYRTYHEVGEGVITIWTDTSSADGPNVIIRASFPWGDYHYRCHHCLPDSPEVPRLVAALHEFGRTGLGNFGAEGEVTGAVDAPRGLVGDTTGLPEPDEGDILAALTVLLASGLLAGIGVTEDRLNRKEPPPEPVIDHLGYEIYPDADGLFGWGSERLTRGEIEARIAQDRATKAESDQWMEEQRGWDEKRRAREEAEAALRIEEWEELQEWGRRLEDRDALLERLELLETDSLRKGEEWWSIFYDEYQRGIQEDLSALPEEMYEGFGDGVRKVAEELSDLENWTVMGETLMETGADIAQLLRGDMSTAVEVLEALHDGVAGGAQIAGELYARFENDRSGSVAGVGKALLGVENWEKVFDKDVKVGERLLRAVWGIIDTGGLMWGAGKGVVKLADKIGDLRYGTRAAQIARIRSQEIKRIHEYIKGLPEGAMIDQNLLAHTGIAGRPLGGLRELSRKVFTRADGTTFSVTGGYRTVNFSSMRRIRDRVAVPKPLQIKPKTINEVDVLLGARADDVGLVGFFEPKVPANYHSLPGDVQFRILERLEERQRQFAKLRKEIEGLVDNGLVRWDRERGVLINTGLVKDPVTGSFREVPFAGDIDAVFWKNADTGQYLTGEEYLQVRKAFVEGGAMGQHGAEVNMIADLTFGKEIGSPEWYAAYEKALNLQVNLERAHRGGEVVVTMGPDGILRRGAGIRYLDIAERYRPPGAVLEV